MRIAFYAPLKAPDHPVPSGDRLMARLLIRALEQAGHRVELASALRSYLPDALDRAALHRLQAEAGEERARIAMEWRRQGPPDLWLCYHPYYKSPDLIGPALAADFGLPWVSVEASLSRRRSHGIWADTQDLVRQAVAGAAVNFGLTARDRAGLRAIVPGARIVALAPFIDLAALPPRAADRPAHDPRRLACVAMMRPGDKLDSYRALAAALDGLAGDWRLAVAGDGAAAGLIRPLFAPGRVDWRGELPPQAVAGLLQGAGIYVWPGCGEAYGLAYLEAQAAGLPVVACATAGVPEVVADGITGLLVAPDDPLALRAAIVSLLADPALQRQMGAAAQERVARRHGIDAAARQLDQVLQGLERGQG